MTNKINVVPYDPNWRSLFKKEAKAIKEILGSKCITVHHIGSTSVVGLSAKPIIDMIPVVKNIEEVDRYNEAMKSIGYEPRGEFGIPFRRYFQKGKKVRFANMHIYEDGNEEIDRHLKFRDWLSNNKADLKSYADLKKQLAQQFPNDILAYCLGKEDFISNIDCKTGWDGIRLAQVLTPREWQAYHRIRKEQLFEPINIIYDPNHPTISAKNYFHFILTKRRQIVTVASIEFLNETEAVLRTLATNEGYKRQGFGKLMLTLLERWVRQQGKKVIKMHAAFRAEVFYRKLGYIEMPFNDPPISNKSINLGKVL